MRFAQKNRMEREDSGRFLLKVDRLKSNGNLSDCEILIKAFQMMER
jgi:hypothetical protein